MCVKVSQSAVLSMQESERRLVSRCNSRYRVAARPFADPVDKWIYRGCNVHGRGVASLCKLPLPLYPLNLLYRAVLLIQQHKVHTGWLSVNLYLPSLRLQWVAGDLLP